MNSNNIFDLSEKAYERIKHVVQFVLPGLGTLYFTLSQIWGLPYGEQVLGTISAVALFLGILLGVSNARYVHDGDIVITEQEGAKVFGFELNRLPEEIEQNKLATFNVIHGDLPGEITYKKSS